MSLLQKKSGDIFNLYIPYHKSFLNFICIFFETNCLLVCLVFDFGPSSVEEVHLLSFLLLYGYYDNTICCWPILDQYILGQHQAWWAENGQYPAEQNIISRTMHCHFLIALMILVKVLLMLILAENNPLSITKNDNIEFELVRIACWTGQYFPVFAQPSCANTDFFIIHPAELGKYWTI